MSGGVSVQSGTIQFWGIQVEVGPIATDLEKPAIGDDLANCFGFYQTLPGVLCSGYGNGAGSFVSSCLGLPVTMRAPPIVALASQTYANASGALVEHIEPHLVRFRITATAAGNCWGQFNVTLSAEA